MDAIFTNEEVNTGRQREFDYLKGIFMLFIYLVHAFQVTLSPEDPLASGNLYVCYDVRSRYLYFCHGHRNCLQPKCVSSDICKKWYPHGDISISE